ncbi:hypothetical protein [Kosakonia sacchari]|uniref:hypothetical protein n=1 Tax=Kosakonia sacchari TaxID=1158459 RepID=UPI001584859A|nr:hypothetical protein [Kosakonia sacchari]NUL38302.1 hypothetical protein [Kosakonia sacchari]
MNSQAQRFYEDDEGIVADLVLSVFGSESIQCINLEADSADEKMKTDIDFLIENQKEFFQQITAETRVYCKRVYDSTAEDVVLVKVYLSPDEEGDFGFMFSTGLDQEHGIGIKFKGLKLKKIGSSEIAFL